MLAGMLGATVSGISGHLVRVEVDVDRGLPSVVMTGLGDATVKEAIFRARRAIVNSDFIFPRNKVVINLLPPWMRKHGSQLDLPVALSILVASKQVFPSLNLDEILVVGELSLDGQVNKCKGLLPMLMAAKAAQVKKAIVPYSCGYETDLCKGIDVIPVTDLRQAVLVLEGKTEKRECFSEGEAVDASRKIGRTLLKQEGSAELVGYENTLKHISDDEEEDFNQIKGQEASKIALAIAVAGGHNILMKGSPGTGKSMMAQRLPTIMPELTEDEFLELVIIYSAADKLRLKAEMKRPFRRPGFRVTKSALIGGGVPLSLGEVTLAHRGVLFLDELNQFETGVLQALREPLENGEIILNRQGIEYHLPSDFMLVAATNPCPCGYLGHPEIRCKCTERMISTYKSRLSGPLMDRIDMHIEVAAVDYEILSSDGNCLSSKDMLKMVKIARNRQKKRQGNRLNGKLSHSEVEKYCVGNKETEALLAEGARKLHLSARGVFKVRKVARTIADIDDVETIGAEHIARALSYRERF